MSYCEVHGDYADEISDGCPGCRAAELGEADPGHAEVEPNADDGTPPRKNGRVRRAAVVGAAIGGFAFGFAGCASCFTDIGNNVPGIPLFNFLTGLLLGAIGGAAIGAVLGLIWAD